MTLQEAIKERILVLDGAMGTMIQRYGLSEADFRGERFKDVPGQMAGNNDLLCLTHPDVVADIHRKYLLAGADIIETNTFNAQRISMADYHVEGCCREINLAAARLARKLADEFTAMEPARPRFVAGSVGPTNKTCSMSPDVENPAYRALAFDELAAAYREQMDALLEGGVDALLVETIFDTLNAKAAIYAAEDAMLAAGRKVPLMLSVTVSDKSGRTLSGQTLELGQYDQTPGQMAEEMKLFVDNGWVNIIGGCCGTTDEYIARFQALAVQGHPHVPAERPVTLCLSGLELFEQTPEIKFVNVGERCNVAGSRKFLRLIKEKKYDEALDIARKQVEDGAMLIDVNMDDGLLDARQEMVTFLNLLASEPEISRVPVMIDSSKWDVITAGLKCVQGKGIVNSISLKEGEEVFLAHAREVKRLGAAVVVMAFDERGQADTYERKVEVCARAYRLLTECVGFNPHDIIFDPNVLAIATGMAEHDRYAVDFIRAAEWIRTHLPGAHVSGGVSNLSFSFRGNNYIREAMHAVFLYHACRAGMDMGIVNPSTSVMYGDIPEDILEVVEDVVLARRPDAAERLIGLAGKLKAADEAGTVGEVKKADAWRMDGVEERLQHALVKGIDTFLQEDLDEAAKCYPHAVNIIEGPLMRGMNTVGELFGAGKMFLPQVVKTARTMKKAVGILQPRIEAEKREGAARAGRVLVATVKGDVHDIGKNIVSVVMACNNYEIIDLGVMVPAGEIVAKALELHPDLIGLSGLITPSLEEMVHVVSELRRAGISVPVMIGGATTSRLHTALKIAPAYDGPVIWVKDASQNALVAARFLNPETSDDAFEALKKEQQGMREKESCKQKRDVVPLEEARRNRLNLFEGETFCQ